MMSMVAAVMVMATLSPELGCAQHSMAWVVRGAGGTSRTPPAVMGIGPQK